MGYRSDVTIVMYPKFGHRDKFAALKLYVDENLPHESDSGFRYLMLELDSVKWYEEDEDDVYMRAFTEWEETFADPNPDPTRSEHAPIFHYEFVRIGEAYADIVCDRSYGSDHILGVDRNAYVNT